MTPFSQQIQASSSSSSGNLASKISINTLSSLNHSVAARDNLNSGLSSSAGNASVMIMPGVLGSASLLKKKKIFGAVGDIMSLGAQSSGAHNSNITSTNSNNSLSSTNNNSTLTNNNSSSTTSSSGLLGRKPGLGS